MSLWFGEPWPRPDWRAPVCADDADRVATPLGAACVLCTEAIEAGDRGMTMGMIVVDDGGTPVAAAGYVHAECSLRSITGNHLHVTGMCRHLGDCAESSTLSFREEAKLVWALQVG